MLLHRITALCLALACSPVFAQEPAPAGMSLAERAARRFPQPVRVGDLLGRDVLQPIEQQHVLGHVAGVVQRSNDILVVVNLGGVLGLGARSVAVPVEMMELLGPYIMVVDLTPKQLRALPTFDPVHTTPVTANETIRVGVGRPPH